MLSVMDRRMSSPSNTGLLPSMYWYTGAHKRVQHLPDRSVVTVQLIANTIDKP